MAAADGRVFELRSHVNEAQGEFLQRLVERVSPALSLEVGLAYGISALFLCEALSRAGCARHIVIDPAQHRTWHGVGLAQLRRAGFESLVDFRELPGHLALPDLVREGARVDFAFVDGNHLYDYVATDFFFLDKLLPVGGVVAFDDANWPSVRRVLRFALSNLHYRVVDALPNALRESPSAPIRWRKYPKKAKSLAGWVALERERRLGLAIPGSRCVALEKVAADDRPFDADTAF